MSDSTLADVTEHELLASIVSADREVKRQAGRRAALLNEVAKTEAAMRGASDRHQAAIEEFERREAAIANAEVVDQEQDVDG